MSKRRIVDGATTVTRAIAERKERLAAPPQAKETYKALTEIAQVERQVYLANLALNKFEVKLEAGEALNDAEDRAFLLHQDSLRKLTTTLSALRSKADLSKAKDHELAKGMLEAGITGEHVLVLYPDDPKVAQVVKEFQK